MLNEIKIRCITEIDVTIENMDYLNYLMAAFNEGLKSSISIDTAEKFRNSMPKKVEKVVAFKLSCKAKPSEEPLTKILQLIDLGVLAAKIFSSELAKRSFIRLEEYQKRQKTCLIFTHY